MNKTSTSDLNDELAKYNRIYEQRYRDLMNSVDDELIGATLERTTNRSETESVISYAFICNDVLSDDMRITWFDKNGLSGHACRPNIEEVVKECLANGFYVKAQISFDETALTDSFQKGNEWLEDLHRDRCGGRTAIFT